MTRQFKDAVATMPVPWKLAMQFGVPGAIAIYVVWLLGNSVSANVQDISKSLTAHTAQTLELQTLMQRQQASLDILIQLQKYTCLHAADSTAERNECYEASRR